MHSFHFHSLREPMKKNSICLTTLQMPSLSRIINLSLGLLRLAAPDLGGLVGLDWLLGLADGGCTGDGVGTEIGAVVAASG